MMSALLPLASALAAVTPALADRDARWLVSALLLLFLGGGLLVGAWEYLSVRREIRRDQDEDDEAR